ncbi:MAG: rod shape-determining protein MreD [Candidatus Nanopelagicus sp.]
MSRIRVLNTSLFLLAVFVIQETIVSRINFPINGFSLYLAALIVILSLEERSGALVFGFIGGLIMDLSATAENPLGQWALALTIVGYLFSVNKESIGDFTDTPVMFLVFISISSALSLTIFLMLGAMLGQNNGSFSHIFSIILANSIWTFLFMPLFLPVVIKIRRALLSNRERV